MRAVAEILEKVTRLRLFNDPFVRLAVLQQNTTMSGASDKARFYLEQAVPQLQEFEQKKIFTKEEIRTLVKKRSDFEHKVLGRGSQPIDFARYAAWEISLERLRAKKCKRMRIKDSTAHTGQARIFTIFDRGTRKHFGDLGLWMSYLQYARDVKSTKKFKTVLTAAIRMHPTKAELWLYAAKWTLEEESDINGARSYMQRGTRFCNRSRDLWIEYAKLEMIFLAKISLRRKILGLDAPAKTGMMEVDEEEEEDGKDAFDTTQDVIAVPDIKSSMLRPSMVEGVEVDTEAVQDPMNTPALNGAIPMAIFDNAKKQLFYDAAAAEAFFNMFAAFTTVHCQARILQHVLDSMLEQYETDAATCSCFIRQPIISIDVTSAQLPAALVIVLERLKNSTVKTSDKALLAKKVASWLEPIAAVEELDAGVRTVLAFTLKKLES